MGGAAPLIENEREDIINRGERRFGRRCGGAARVDGDGGGGKSARERPGQREVVRADGLGERQQWEKIRCGVFCAVRKKDRKKIREEWAPGQRLAWRLLPQGEVSIFLFFNFHKAQHKTITPTHCCNFFYFGFPILLLRSNRLVDFKKIYNKMSCLISRPRDVR
jgi:hypothetical protein